MVQAVTWIFAYQMEHHQISWLFLPLIKLTASVNWVLEDENNFNIPWLHTLNLKPFVQFIFLYEPGH